MAIKATIISLFAIAVLVASAPSASACHGLDLGPLSACTEWDDPPWGVEPFATGAAACAAGEAIRVANYAEETAEEVVGGCD